MEQNPMYTPPVQQYPMAASPQKSSGPVPLILSIIAVVLSLVAVLLSFTKNPLGKGLDSYDFSTPEAALKSRMQIRANSDIQAQIDLEKVQQGTHLEEALRTLEVHRTVDFEDKKIVFFSYMKGGEKEKEYEAFEKDLETKLWFRKFISISSVRDSNDQLADDMASWEE